MSSNWDFNGFHMISWDVQSTLAWSCEGIYPQSILVAGFQVLTPAIQFSKQASKNHKFRVCWGILHVRGEGLCVYIYIIMYIYIHILYYIILYYIRLYYIILYYIILYIILYYIILYIILYYIRLYYIILYIYIVNRSATLDFSNQDRYHGQSWRIRANHGHGFSHTAATHKKKL